MAKKVELTVLAFGKFLKTEFTQLLYSKAASQVLDAESIRDSIRSFLLYNGPTPPTDDARMEWAVLADGAMHRLTGMLPGTRSRARPGASPEGDEQLDLVASALLAVGQKKKDATFTREQVRAFFRPEFLQVVEL